MASASRSAQFVHVHKVLKKHYKPVAPDPRRPVLEHLLLGCCLEDAHYAAADEAFAALVHGFFDWNEVRVTSIRELCEVMAGLPAPQAAAGRLKRVLQSIFEASYSFDLEELRKKNLGPTVKWLETLDGTTAFTIAYVTQAALGGHAIPVDTSTLRALHAVDLVTAEDVAAGIVPGLERAISKAKGIEFGSLLHQLGADFTANPYAANVRKTLLEINPDAADRLPKRRAAKKAAEAPASTKKTKKVRRKKTADQPAEPPVKKQRGRKKKAPANGEPTSADVAEAPKEGRATKGLSKRKPR